MGLPSDEEDRLTAEFERDVDRDDLWEEVPAPQPSGRRTLGTQVTIRLDGRSAEQLRSIASARGIGYTSLLRAWIEERLRVEDAVVEAGRTQITMAGESMTRTPFQLSGAGHVVLHPGTAG